MDDMDGGINKDASYVIKETKFLADQLSEDVVKSYVVDEIKHLESQIKKLKKYA